MNCPAYWLLTKGYAGISKTRKFDTGVTLLVFDQKSRTLKPDLCSAIEPSLQYSPRYNIARSKNHLSTIEPTGLNTAATVSGWLE